jgi:hypothetical protein
MKQILLMATLFVGVSLTSITCKDVVVQPQDKTFTLTAEDASCTEVYLRIKIGLGNANREVTLKRDTVLLFTRTFNDFETVVIDTNLTPNHTYTYTAFLLNNSLASSSTVQTMDTTSQNITWTTQTLGDGTSSSTLYDVAIINDTLAYAVGEIHSGGSVYNLAKWNGQTWELLQLQFYTFCGQLYTGAYPTKAIFAFSATDIWITSGSEITHYDGNNQISITCFPVSAYKLWGTSSNNLYAVGALGGIAKYNGSSWTKIESGTTLDVRDIYGAQNTKTGEWEICATAGDPLISPERKILHISGNTAESISDNGINWALNCVWFSPGRYYWIVGDGVWEKHPTLSMPSWNSKVLTTYTIDAVRGNSINDVFMCGAFGEMLHFNGNTWRSYRAQTGLTGAYLSLSVKGNLVIAVGEKSPQAVVLIGRK